MGIAGFTKWVRLTFPHCVLGLDGNDDAAQGQARSFRGRGAPPPVPAKDQGPSDTFDHVLIDINSFFHIAMRHASDEAEVMRRVFINLDRIIKLCVPRKSLFLAIDGTAPYAKLVTQRQRRRAPNDSKVFPVDPVQVSPGMEFMLHVEIMQRSMQKPQLRNVRFTLSGARVPGEGEHKIIRHMLREVPSQFRNDSFVIVSTDADILLLGMATGFPNVYQLTSSGKTQRNYNTILMIGELLRCFSALFPGQLEPVRTDFIFMSLLMGNDYLPKLRGTSMASLWRAYRFLRQHPQHRRSFCVRSDHSINWPFVLLLMFYGCVPVAPLERFKFDDLSHIGMTHGHGKARRRLLDLLQPDTGPVANHDDMSLSSGVSSAGTGSTAATAASSFSAGSKAADVLDEIDDSMPVSDTVAYVQGLLWNMEMYMCGVCLDYWYHYEYRAAPSWNELIDWYNSENPKTPFRTEEHEEGRAAFRNTMYSPRSKTFVNKLTEAKEAEIKSFAQHHKRSPSAPVAVRTDHGVSFPLPLRGSVQPPQQQQSVEDQVVASPPGSRRRRSSRTPGKEGASAGAATVTVQTSDKPLSKDAEPPGPAPMARSRSLPLRIRGWLRRRDTHAAASAAFTTYVPSSQGLPAGGNVIAPRDARSPLAPHKALMLLLPGFCSPYVPECLRFLMSEDGPFALVYHSRRPMSEALMTRLLQAIDAVPADQYKGFERFNTYTSTELIFSAASPPPADAPARDEYPRIPPVLPYTGAFFKPLPAKHPMQCWAYDPPSLLVAGDVPDWPDWDQQRNLTSRQMHRPFRSVPSEWERREGIATGSGGKSALAWYHDVSTIAPYGSGRSRSRGSNKSNAARRCYRCGAEGHLQRACPLLKDGAGDSTGRGKGKGKA